MEKSPDKLGASQLSSESIGLAEGNFGSNSPKEIDNLLATDRQTQAR
jgi:hypothetical protein